LGNYSAELWRLWRLWRDFAVTTEVVAAKVLERLVDHDLVRLYDLDGKRYLHVPRFAQRLRYVKRVFPLSPWTTDEQKQAIARNSPGESQARTGSAHQKGSEVKGSEVKKSVRSRATRLAPDWVLPEDLKAWAMEAYNLTSVQVIRIAADFKDYWIAASGANACKLDWPATFRRWIRKETANAR